MNKDEINYRHLTKKQLEQLKDIYILSRVNSMTESELKKFATEVLELQVRGTVGNEEEREVWKEMKEHFGDDFSKHLNSISKNKEAEAVDISPEEEEFKKRLDALNSRQSEETNKIKDMW